jgi:cation:H+ antiporter
MLTEVITVLMGVILILLMAEVIIRSSISLAGHYGLSESFIGLTILSIGTSIPEIMSHIIGSIGILRSPDKLNTLSGLLLGTNVGSDIFQETFILAVVGLIGTIVVIRKDLNKQVGMLIGAAILTLLVALGGIINRWEGLLLLTIYALYLFYLKRNNDNSKIKAKNNLDKKELLMSFSLILGGFIIMAILANLVLGSSVILVEALPISASFFGVILLGIASALPELTTSIAAILKNKRNISAGILIGSNITNPLFGIGLGALISTYTVPKVIIAYDLPFKILVAVLIYIFLLKTQDINKKEAIVLITLFITFLIVRNIFYPVDF